MVDAVGLGDRQVGDREEADDHRIVIGGAVGRRRLEDDARRHQRGAVGLLLEGRLAGAVADLVVVVEEVDLVGVDVPGVDAGDLRQQAGAREGVVEVAELAVEEVGVGVGAEEARSRDRCSRRR